MDAIKNRFLRIVFFAVRWSHQMSEWEILYTRLILIAFMDT